MTEIKKEHLEVINVIDQTDFNNTFVVGYYGGGNFGDELLAEVLIELLLHRGNKRIATMDLGYGQFDKYHLKKQYDVYSLKEPLKFLFRILRSKNVIVGGGGIWGRDFNNNVLLLSFLLFCLKVIFRKKVYLFGVGYYNSTSKLGHKGAWLSARFADMILARDEESYGNYHRLTQNRVYLCEDIAFSLNSISIEPYEKGYKKFEATMPKNTDTVLITLRRFSRGEDDAYRTALERWLSKNRSREVLISLLEPKALDPSSWDYLMYLKKTYPSIKIRDFSFNSIYLYLYFKRNSKRIKIITPQFHTMLIASLTGVKFLPFSYDNKVDSLFTKLGIKDWPQIENISEEMFNKFLNKRND